MTLSTTFFDKVKYKSQDFAARDADIFGSGIRNLTDFPLTYPETPNMTVNVGVGVARVNGGYRIANDSNTITLTFGTADPTNPRVDIIQIGYTASTDANGDTTGTPILQVKQGVPGATPIEPGADPNFVKLYAVNINANQTTITAPNVVDRRTLWSINADGSQITHNSSVTTDDPAYQAVANETYVQAGTGIQVGAPTSGVGQTVSLADDGTTDVKIGNRTADSTQAPSGLVGTLTQWFSWIANRIKAITGTTNWYDAPPTTLTAANAHMTNTNNPHNVTAAQVGAVPESAAGQANGVCDLGADGQVPANRLGHVPPVNAATGTALGTVELPASAGSPATPVAAYRANSVKEFLLADTNLDSVLTFTPAASGNFLVGVSVRVVTAATNVTIKITWTDASGALQTDTRCSNANLGIGPHDVPVKFINANASPITVQVQAGTANQVFASASIVGV